MAKEQQNSTEASAATAQEPRSLAISSGGVNTGEEFANLMSAIMSDVIDGRLQPQVANAVCNAGGKLLKVVEMQYKYASRPTQPETPGPPIMMLTRPKGSKAQAQ